MANNTVYPYGPGGQLPSGIAIVNDFVTGGADKALSAEAGKTFYEEVFGENESEAYTKADATVYKTKNGQVVTSGYPRIRVIIELKRGDTMAASCSLGKGVAASVYANLSDALYAGTNYLQTISYTYASSLSGTLEVDGLLTVSLAKTDDSNFTDAEYADYLAALTLTGMRQVRGEGAITALENEVDALRGEISNVSIDKSQPVFIGTLVQKSMTASGLSDNAADKRVSMASCIVVPREGATLTFKLPDGYCIGIRNGERAENLTNNNYWYYDGDTFTFASNVRFYRLCFAKDSGSSTLTVSEVNAYIASGAIGITAPYEQGIVERQRENEKYVKAVMRNWVEGITLNGSLTKLPIFAHTSDVHGDATRFGAFLDYCDYLKVDAALVSGDCVAYYPAESWQYINDLADTHSTMVLPCVGNHDIINKTTKQVQNETTVGYLITKNNSVTLSGETYPTFFYQDIVSKSIRVISLNLYESGQQTTMCDFTQTQCEWFISALASTPANYGVLLMFHSPEARPSKDNNYPAFYQDLLNWTGYHDGLTGNVFRTIVDAFIGKTSVTFTYTSKRTNITVSADFTGVASGVEFIAYVNGHLHVDEIGYIPGSTYKQLNLNVNCCNAIYGDTYQGLANLSDLPRGCVGATQDCFNIYAVDRAAKVVRIAKVGSNVTGNLVDRKFMSIPYAE